MAFPQLSFWILKVVAFQFWPVWFLALLFAWGCRRLASMGWPVIRLVGRFGFILGCLMTFALVWAFCQDLRFSLTAPGSALTVKGWDAEFGVIFAAADGSLGFRTYQIPAWLGIDLAGKAGRYRERPLPIIRLSPESPASPGPKRPVTDPGRQSTG